MTELNSVFFNLTNHPSEKWDSIQRDAARQYGEIEDIPFPDISPFADSDEIAQKAESYVSLIQSYPADRKIVHVMGEMTFTYAVVSRLKALGIACVASTTKRDAIETDDGKKITVFRFVQFRKY